MPRDTFQSRIRDAPQISRGKFNRRHRTPALDGSGLRGHLAPRPTGTALYPVPVRQVAALLHASFRQRLATMPLRFANTSGPSTCGEDLNLLTAEHARRTKESPADIGKGFSVWLMSDSICFRS
jgi:hypothetical protein